MHDRTHTDSPRQATWALAPAALFLLVLPLNHTMALRLLSLFAAFGVALWSARKHGIPPISVKWPLLAWAGLALLSVTWSANPAFSLGEIKVEIGYGMMAFFTFFTLTRTEREWRLWLNLIIASLAVTMALSLFKYWSIYPAYYDWEDVHGYVSYSTYLATIAPFLLLWLITGRLRWLGILLLATFVGVAYLNTNRMLWVSFLAVLMVFAIVFGLHLRGPKAKVRIIVVLLAGVLISGTLFTLVANEHPTDAGTPSSIESRQSHIIQTFTQTERYRIWQFWLERLAEHPVAGVGFGRDLPHLVYEKPTDWPGLFFAHGHNLVLNYGLQMGIPGMLVLLILFGAIGKGFLQMAKLPDDQHWHAGVVGLGLVVAVFTKNMTDDLFWRTDALLFWALAGMLLGCGARLGKAAP